MKHITFILIFLAIPAILLAANTEYIVTASNLNVRIHPTPTSDVLFKVKKGERVSVVEKKEQWAYIDVAQGKGWVSKKYLKPIDPIEEAKEAPYSETLSQLRGYFEFGRILVYSFALLGLLLFICLYHTSKQRDVLTAHWLVLGGCTLILLPIAHFVICMWSIPAFFSIIVFYPFVFTKISKKALGWSSAIWGIVVTLLSYLIAIDDYWLLIALPLTGCTVALYAVNVFILLSNKCPDCSHYADQILISKTELENEMQDTIKYKNFYHSGVLYKTELHHYRERKFEKIDMCPKCQKEHIHHYTEKEELPVRTVYANSRPQPVRSTTEKSSNTSENPPEEIRKDITGESREGLRTICGHCCYWTGHLCSYLDTEQHVSFDTPACFFYSP